MKVYSYDFYWSEHLASTFKVRAQAFLFLCASRGLRRADLASGMSLALLSIMPGFLFPLGRGLEPLSRRPVFSARPPRAPLTKLDPGGVYGDFLSFPVLENQASTTSGLVGRFTLLSRAEQSFGKRIMTAYGRHPWFMPCLRQGAMRARGRGLEGRPKRARVKRSRCGCPAARTC